MVYTLQSYGNTIPGYRLESKTWAKAANLIDVTINKNIVKVQECGGCFHNSDAACSVPLAKYYGIPFLSTYRAIQMKDITRLWCPKCPPNEMHFNELGHNLHAELLISFLKVSMKSLDNTYARPIFPNQTLLNWTNEALPNGEAIPAKEFKIIRSKGWKFQDDGGRKEGWRAFHRGDILVLQMEYARTLAIAFMKGPDSIGDVEVIVTCAKKPPQKAYLFGRHTSEHYIIGTELLFLRVVKCPSPIKAPPGKKLYHFHISYLYTSW
eukprot:NODE_6248_length_907_cov_36.114796_g5656_i0.p1 GENE.NODE_6248_length_907_cov_36.114796_g5656_i0~~NODE_6248_length_907_cov_36.114796_g5656_i0.p1  ORF type:complete len:289 (+),score=39.72 NODE_6248_length_907_cov_36.114796_g5656_i0:70-867(+)